MSEPDWFRRASSGNNSSYKNGSSSTRRSYYGSSSQSKNNSSKSGGGSTWSQMVKDSGYLKRQEEERKAAEIEALRLKAENERKRQAEEDARQRHGINEERKQQVLKAENYARAQYAETQQDYDTQDNPQQSGYANPDRLTVDVYKNQQIDNIDQPQQASDSDKPQQPKPPMRKPSVAALDGLRSLAIIGVLLYHLSVTWCVGGLLGVTVFFVLSGYLITGIIWNQIDNTGKFDLKDFWIRRVRRLFPAIVIVVLSVLVLCAIFNHILLTKARDDVIPSLFWFQNWWYIIRDLSYFDNLGDPSPLVHFWSLAIEEQFYLFWPLIILAMKKLGCKSKHVFVVCLVLAGLSAAEMMLLYDPAGDPTRVYYGTDTRAFSLLIGGALAIICPWQQVQKHGCVNLPNIIKIRLGFNNIVLIESEKDDLQADDTTLDSPRQSNLFKIIDIAGIIATLCLILLMIFIDGTSDAMYYGVLLLASLLTAIIILSLITPNTILSKIFALQPLVWIGRRSYSIYLWHVPILLLLKPLSGGFITWWVSLLVIAITTVVAALQYHFIEEPCRHGAIGKLVAKIRSDKALIKRWGISLCVAVAVLIGAIIAIYAIPAEYALPEDSIASSDAPTDQAEQLADTSSSERASEIGNSASFVSTCKYPMLIGDSVTSGVEFKQYLSSLYTYAYDDSAVGRKAAEVVSIVQQYLNQGVVGNVLVVAGFNNHPANKGEIQQLYDIVGSNRELFLVTTFTPYPLTETNNSQMKALAQQHENVHIIDWYSVASQYTSELLYKDNVHLTPTGTTAYMNLIVDSINSYLPSEARINLSALKASPYVKINLEGNTGGDKGDNSDSEEGQDSSADDNKGSDSNNSQDDDSDNN